MKNSNIEEVIDLIKECTATYEIHDIKFHHIVIFFPIFIFWSLIIAIPICILLSLMILLLFMPLLILALVKKQIAEYTFDHGYVNIHKKLTPELDNVKPRNCYPLYDIRLDIAFNQYKTAYIRNALKNYKLCEILDTLKCCHYNNRISNTFRIFHYTKHLLKDFRVSIFFQDLITRRVLVPDIVKNIFKIYGKVIEIE
jgi:hypothetical protein